MTLPFNRRRSSDCHSFLTLSSYIPLPEKILYDAHEWLGQILLLENVRIPDPHGVIILP